MAIDRMVIRYLPYETNAAIDYLGVSRHPLPEVSRHTAVYPDHLAETLICFFYDDALFVDKYYSGLDLGAAGLTGAVREWSFVTLADDGATLAPIDATVDAVHVAYGYGYSPSYSGGVVEIGVYRAGEYQVLGAQSIGVDGPGDPYSDSESWVWPGWTTVRLTWPGPPAFWTALKDSIETS